MKTHKCALFVFDTYADWEPALAIARLRAYGAYQIDSFSLTREPVTSMGGLSVLPSLSLAEISAADYDILLLPGGEAWEQGKNEELAPLVQEFRKAGKVVAAICGATLLLAKLGMLNQVPHTSNFNGYLSMAAPAYHGEALYETTPSVGYQHLITANGAGMIEFAHEIFKAVEMMDVETLEKVQLLYKSGGLNNQLMPLT